MFDPVQLLLVVCAIAIGWLLGRRTKLLNRGTAHGGSASQHYKSLNYLINDEPDGALDAFINSLEVNSDTLETHLAVGNLMRRKGEVERAIRIHQNLLARPSLTLEHIHQAHLELSKDYISAGLLDRAERLLEDLIEDAPELRPVAMRHLLEIYQDEQEWQQAIDTAKKLVPKKSLLKPKQAEDSDLKIAMSHYCCELAEQVLEKNDYHSARSYLKQALSNDRNCVRASLVQAEVEYRTAHYDQAIKALHRVYRQQPEHVIETMQLLKQCHKALGTEDQFHDYLMMVLDSHPSASILLELVENIQSRQGDVAAAQFIGQQLKLRPSLRGLSKLVELHIANSNGAAKENLTILQLLIEQLIQNKPHYQCHHCGFTGKQLHWLCPTCKQWDQMTTIRGAEGE